MPSMPSVPDETAASLYAETIRWLLSDRAPAYAPLLDLDPVCATLGIIAERRTLRGAAGGVEATIAPLDGNQFRVVVDPEPAGGWERVDEAIQEDVARQRYRFRLAHELCHTLFYDRSGIRPTRRFSVTRREEAFCDRFARALLLPDVALSGCDATPAEVLRIQREYDVSLELCLRAFAEVHAGGVFALLLARRGGAPVLRPQWVSAAELPARWWTADWLQRSLSQRVDGDRAGVIQGRRGALECLWRPLPHRRQVVITAAQLLI